MQKAYCLSHLRHPATRNQTGNDECQPFSTVFSTHTHYTVTNFNTTPIAIGIGSAYTTNKNNRSASTNNAKLTGKYGSIPSS